MNAKERLIQFVDFQDISKRKFCEKISVSESYFTKKGAVGSEVLEKISHEYPYLNLDWVITGNGNMLKEPHQNQATNAPADGLIDSGATDDIMALDITIENKILMLRDRVAMQAIEIRMLNRLVYEYEQKLNKQNVGQSDNLVS